MLAMSNLQAASTFNLDGWPRAGCPRSICPRLPTLYTGHSRLLARSCRRSLPRKHFTLGPRLFYLLFPEADLNFRLFVRFALRNACSISLFPFAFAARTLALRA